MYYENADIKKKSNFILESPSSKMDNKWMINVCFTEGSFCDTFSCILFSCPQPSSMEAIINSFTQSVVTFTVGKLFTIVHLQKSLLPLRVPLHFLANDHPVIDILVCFGFVFVWLKSHIWGESHTLQCKLK